MPFSDTKECKICGKTFARPTKGSKRKTPKEWLSRLYCGNVCRAKGCAKTGPANWNWKGGNPHCVDCGVELAERYTIRKSKRCHPCAGIARRGSAHPNWKGGITPLRTSIWKSEEYQSWRTSVFERDGYRCVMCGDESGGNLEADHIYPFALFPEHRFNIYNGRTLCRDCHKTTETWGYGTVLLTKRYAI